MSPLHTRRPPGKISTGTTSCSVGTARLQSTSGSFVRVLFATAIESFVEAPWEIECRLLQWFPVPCGSESDCWWREVMQWECVLYLWMLVLFHVYWNGSVSVALADVETQWNRWLNSSIFLWRIRLFQFHRYHSGISKGLIEMIHYLSYKRQ